MAEPAASSYDAVPYHSQAFFEAHPDRMAVVATLLGMSPPAVATARVLEIGCAGGGNLIPMAASLPEGHFVGVDLSPRQVAQGQEIIEKLGLSNIELRAMSLTDLGDDLGPFDYIISHGIFSWVPPAVQDRLLEVSRRLLAPEGVAYVSYNTLPGWHLRGLLRDMMMYHVGGIADLNERIPRARELVEQFAAAHPEPNSPHAIAIRQEVERLRGESDSYLAHEHLEEENHAFHFAAFVAHAAAHGLKYAGDARIRTHVEFQPTEVRQLVERFATDPIRAEQYHDFLRNRTFRRSLLCHEAAHVGRQVDPQALRRLLIATNVAPLRPDPDIATEGAEAFRAITGQSSLNTNGPIVKAALVILFEHWPRAIAFNDLKGMVRDRLLRAGAPPEAVDRPPVELEAALLQCHVAGAVELHAHEPHFAATISDQPAASPYARLMAESGNRVVNLRHRLVDLSDFDRLVIRQLDGRRDEYAIIDALDDAIERGEFTLYQDNQPLKDRLRVRQILGRSLDPSLNRLARSLLLVG